VFLAAIDHLSHYVIDFISSRSGIMIRPNLLMGMKQSNDQTTFWINRRLAISFLSITKRASKAKILKDRFSTSYQRLNMLKFKRHCR
jgi:hypothetical protein